MTEIVQKERLDDQLTRAERIVRTLEQTERNFQRSVTPILVSPLHIREESASRTSRLRSFIRFARENSSMPPSEFEKNFRVLSGASLSQWERALHEHQRPLTAKESLAVLTTLTSYAPLTPLSFGSEIANDYLENGSVSNATLLSATVSALPLGKVAGKAIRALLRHAPHQIEMEAARVFQKYFATGDMVDHIAAEIRKRVPIDHFVHLLQAQHFQLDGLIRIGGDSAVFRLKDGSILKLNEAIPRPGDIGRRFFDAPILEEGRIAVKIGNDERVIHYFRQPLCQLDVTHAEYEIFTKELQRKGYRWIDDDGVNQLGRLNGRVVLLDPFSVGTAQDDFWLQRFEQFMKNNPDMAANLAKVRALRPHLGQK